MKPITPEKKTSHKRKYNVVGSSAYAVHVIAIYVLKFVSVLVAEHLRRKFPLSTEQYVQERLKEIYPRQMTQFISDSRDKFYRPVAPAADGPAGVQEFEPLPN